MGIAETILMSALVALFSFIFRAGWRTFQERKSVNSSQPVLATFWKHLKPTLPTRNQVHVVS